MKKTLQGEENQSKTANMKTLIFVKDGDAQN
jgi:hypothetical protein